MFLKLIEEWKIHGVPSISDPGAAANAVTTSSACEIYNDFTKAMHSGDELAFQRIKNWAEANNPLASCCAGVLHFAKLDGKPQEAEEAHLLVEKALPSVLAEVEAGYIRGFTPTGDWRSQKKSRRSGEVL